MNHPRSASQTPVQAQILWLKNFRSKLSRYQSTWGLDPMVSVALESDATRLIHLLHQESVKPKSEAGSDFQPTTLDDNGASSRILSFICYIKSRPDYNMLVAEELGIVEEGGC